MQKNTVTNQRISNSDIRENAKEIPITLRKSSNPRGMAHLVTPS